MTYARHAGWATLAFALIAASPCRAQDNQGNAATAANPKDEIALTRADVQKKRQEIVQQVMEFTPQESEKFWPVYREYQADAAKLGDQRVALIETYMTKAGTMSDTEAKEMLDKWFKLRQGQLDLQKKYVGKFNKVLAPVRVARLYQIENALDAIISANLQANMPVIGASPQ
jgi:hypothetical protein